MRIGGRSVFLGAFERETDAAIAVDRVALAEGRLPPNFPRRRHEPASVAETRAWAKELRRERLLRGAITPKGPSGFWGVQERNGRFYVHLSVSGVQVSAGAYFDAVTAAIARDRAVRFIGLETPLNFPSRARHYTPASPAALRSEAASLARRHARGRYIGVSPSRSPGWWHAKIVVRGQHHYIARYADQVDAARAYDRAILAYVGPGATRNFPEEDLHAASIEQLREEAAAKRPVTTSSAFFGVARVPRVRRGAWRACIGSIVIGHWPTEREAALAHDRAALYLPGPRRKLNFPKEARKLGPATPAELRAEARRITKQACTSLYRGVCWCTRDRRWNASIYAAGKQTNLGYFVDELEAARAYDRAARRLHGARAQLNFGRAKR